MRQNVAKAEREKRELALEREEQRRLFTEHEAQQCLFRDASKRRIMVHVYMVLPIVMIIVSDAFIFTSRRQSSGHWFLNYAKTVHSGRVRLVQALAFCFSPSFCPGQKEKRDRAYQIMENERRRDKERLEKQADDDRVIAECKQKLREEQEAQVGAHKSLNAANMSEDARELMDTLKWELT